MIEIDINKNQNKIKHVQVKGHAGYGDYGTDIVCSAISSITITIINGLTDICFIKDLEINVEDGFVSLKVPENLNARDSEILDLFLNTLELGYKDIEEGYPDYIKINYTEVK